MRYTGIQPQYFPRLHYFARILNTDVFVIRDDVQFVRKHKYPGGKKDSSFQADSQIKQARGIYYLTVPVKDHGFNSLNDTKIAYDHKWVVKHIKTIEYAYAKSPYFSLIFPEIDMILRQRYDSLTQLDLVTIIWSLFRISGEESSKISELTLDNLNRKLSILQLYRLKKILLASKTKTAKNLQNASPNEKILSLIKEAGANEDFCGGTAIAAYMNQKLFERNGIKITVQDWKCPEYNQLFIKEQGFIPNLSIIDLMMNVSSKKISDFFKD